VVLDAQLPVGTRLPNGTLLRGVRFGGIGWQIHETEGHGRALIVAANLGQRWLDAGLLDPHVLQPFQFGAALFHTLSSGPSQALSPVAEAAAPSSKSEALAFALALRATRESDPNSPLQDAIYVERVSRLLPTYEISPRTEDDVVLGYWLTGGAPVPAGSFRRLQSMLSWLPPAHLKDVVEAAGFEVLEVVPDVRRDTTKVRTAAATAPEPGSPEHNEDRSFELPGRPELEAFLNEHVVDIVQNRERYRALGISFPSAIILHGPPGTGKTFAVERLTDFLGWPSFQVDASSVASPYIHETSRKISQVFEQAMENAPSVLVIDEMEAFLTERDTVGGHHRVEEIAEFLRRIPEATKNDVLIIAMTNRIDMIDEAILRRGRFDHVIKVDYAGEPEMRALLVNLLAAIPLEGDVAVQPLAKQLAGRPLSDAAFIVREAARLAAKAGKDGLDQESLEVAVSSAPRRERDEGQRRIGFI